MKKTKRFNFHILQLFIFLILLLTKVKSGDYGMIAYFANDCPEGW